MPGEQVFAPLRALVWCPTRTRTRCNLTDWETYFHAKVRIQNREEREREREARPCFTDNKKSLLRRCGRVGLPIARANVPRARAREKKADIRGGADAAVTRDQYCSKKRHHKTRVFSLLGFCCLWIEVKYEEINCSPMYRWRH